MVFGLLLGFLQGLGIVSCPAKTSIFWQQVCRWRLDWKIGIGCWLSESGFMDFTDFYSKINLMWKSKYVTLYILNLGQSISQRPLNFQRNRDFSRSLIYARQIEKNNTINIAAALHRLTAYATQEPFGLGKNLATLSKIVQTTVYII